MLGGEIVRLGSIGSTMDVLDERARGGAGEGLVIVADEQTKGRGRAGRAWSAPPGSSLLCSILLRPPVDPDRLGTLPLVAGVAVAEAVETFVKPQCGLKWPNDALIDGRKIAGILIQSRLSGAGVEFVNVGIGINIATDRAFLPDGATSIAAEGGSAGRDELLTALLDRLSERYGEFVALNGRPHLAEWRRRAAFAGERVTVRQDGREVQGVLDGVDDDGRLRLLLDSGETRLLAQGDVERGPRVESAS